MKLETRNLKYALPALLLTALQAFGFEAVMKIQPPLIELSESAVLSLEVREAKNVQPPDLPDVPGLRMVFAGQSQQSTWINGKSDSFTAFNYRIYPQRTGSFSIGPFEYRADGQTKTVAAVELQVVGTAGGAQPAQNWSDMLFARVEADRSSAYVQEPFTLTLSIYSRQDLQLAGNISLGGMPQTGLQDLQWEETAAGREAINNAIYNVRRFQARTRAMSSGLFEFAPSVTVQVAVPAQQGSGRPRSMFSDPFFDSFFSRTETRPVEVQAGGTAVDVKPLPEAGRPEGFSGAVGRFDFQVRAQPLEVHPGDPITLQMLISGDGNFDRLMMPALPFDDRFRLFGEPVRKQAEHTVLFEQVISPRSADVKEIPAVSFSFFDAGSGQYRTVQSAPIPINVTATSNGTAQVFAAKDSFVLPPPERPFATESDLQRIATVLKRVWQSIRPWLWAVPAALVAGLTALAGRKLYLRRKGDTARMRRQKAPKAARKALRAADHALRRSDAATFYDALWDALTEYFGNRLNLPPGEVTSAATLDALSRTGFDPDLLSTVREIFEQVEASRYGRPAAAGAADNMRKLKDRLEQALRTCEKTRFPSLRR